MDDKECKTKVLITTVPPEAKGGIVALHQVLLDPSLQQSFDLRPFQFSSPMPFEESLTGRLFRIFNKVNRFAYALMKDRTIRIVHINTAPDSKAILRDTLLIFISWLLRRKVVLQIHGAIGTYNYTKVVGWVVTRCFCLCDKILVFSKKDLKRIEASVPKEKTRTFPNAIRINNFRIKGESFKSHISVPKDNKIILFLSRFIKQKGVFEVIESIPRVIREFEKVNFVFAGDGPEIAKMKEACKQSHLEEWVRFTGHLKYGDVLRAFGCSDIFVLPTYYIEGLPMAILQALAAGLPIISTRYGAIPDIIEDGVHGYLIEPHAPTQLTEKILLLLRRDDIRMCIRDRNVQLAKKEFDAKVVLNRLEQLYAAL